MSRAALLVLALLLPTTARAAAPPPRPMWLAVVAPEFVEAISPLLEARREQGFRVVLVKTTDALSEEAIQAGNASKLRDRVRALCRAHPGESVVLLVGAVDSLFAGRIVPPCVGVSGRMKGQPTDAPYGCPNGEKMPTVAVGRFPARSVEEVTSMVARTLTHEAAGKRPGAWKRRITVLAGIPAYNPLVDRLVEAMAIGRFDRLHPTWTGKAVYTNPLSRFCLPEKELRSRSLACLVEGQAFTLYLGHSNAQGLYAGPDTAFLDRADWGRVARVPHGGGVFVTFGCNGCQLGGIDGEGYGLWAMRNPEGPAAVLGSHGICFAAMVNLGADGLFRRAFQTTTPARLAPAWLATLEGVARGKIDFLSYHALDAVDGDSRIPQATQRLEHLEMFVLLGDPALRIPAVEEIVLDAPKTVMPGEKLEVKGVLPAELASAEVEITLERLPSSAPSDLLAVPRQPGPARDKAQRHNHVRANDFALARATVTARAGRFVAVVTAPDTLPYFTCLVRVTARAKEREAIGASRLSVRQQR